MKMVGAILSFIPLLTVLVSCTSVPKKNLASATVQNRMTNYVFNTSLAQLRQQVIDSVISDRDSGSNKKTNPTSTAADSARPLQDYPFVFDGKMREPSGASVPNPFAVTETNWETKNAPLPYDIVENSTKRFVLVHGNFLYYGHSVDERKCELRVYELHRFRRLVDRVNISSKNTERDPASVTAQVGVIDLDASLHDATRDLSKEWAVFERVEPEKASQIYDQEAHAEGVPLTPPSSI